MTPPSLPLPDITLAGTLFDTLRQNSLDGTGITRDSYGKGEQAAHDLIIRTAQSLDLEVAIDGTRNLYVTLPGVDRSAPCTMTGSHLDSVPAGGNYDGAAGVVAGMAVLAGWRAAGLTPPHDMTVMGVRAEESTWFPYSYLGSKGAFGQIDSAAVLALPRSDTGRSLASHLTECGGDPATFGQAWLSPDRIARFVELHIEQGPVLIEAGLPVGVVTGIRGAIRYRDARAVGTYAHSGAVPRRSRHDAVRAAALFIAAIDQDWERLEDAGRDLVITFGKLSTNPAQHAFSKVAGEIDICMDIRSLEPETLIEVDALLARRAAEIADRARVQFVLGERTGSAPAVMDVAIIAQLSDAAKALGIPAMRIASGAGHDAAVFAQNGIPTGMIFVRNDRGSHNPEEAMDMNDFAMGARLLAHALCPSWPARPE
ncbi:Zn-dependent hydrolase [Pigmentiphaga litoralis]|uniref:Zn-dependent hydrolase n=1 Tax=Pigmentiphaga litoralis TaxID=516702 RepID=UPI001676D9FA|nr:Zn-dependent hydrolase [Pigmentiphaga litoralis]GGX21924.1 Zn-dependent hydrolase [Pigmentiphaga litoralis]